MKFSPPRRSGRVASDLTPTHAGKPYRNDRSGSEFMLHIEPVTDGQVSDAQRAMTLLAMNRGWSVGEPAGESTEVWCMLGLDRKAS